MKKFNKALALVLALTLVVVVFAACGNGSGKANTTTSSTGTTAASGSAWFGSEGAKDLAASGIVNTTGEKVTGDASKVKVGVILVGDENEGYTYAHIEGIKEAAKAVGIKDSQIVWKYSIKEDESCTDAAKELVDAGCTVIFANSYGHQTYMQKAAKTYPKVTFVSMTGDTAKASGLKNFCNAFTDIYEARYVSGVVAGLKLNELVANGTLTKAKLPKSFDNNGNIKIGYVGAYPYAEVVSGYTAFFLGVKSVCKNITMEVQYTNSWFDITKEGTAADTLMADGCVIIGQHADSTGAPAAVEAAQKKGTVAYSVGYNVDMSTVAPNAALTSATNTWSVYYTYALTKAVNGEKIDTNWTGGYAQGAVAITALGKSCAKDTQKTVDSVIANIKAGKINVFDTSTFTVGGKTLTWCYATDTDGNFTNDANNAIAKGFYHESYVQSAPSFALRIDGIKELNTDKK